MTDTSAKYTCPGCFRTAPWTDGMSKAAGDDADEFWCQTCGEETLIGDVAPLDRDPLDTADYVRMGGDAPEPEDTYCRNCGQRAIDHSPGRYSVFGLCPEPTMKSAAAGQVNP